MWEIRSIVCRLARKYSRIIYSIARASAKGEKYKTPKKNGILNDRDTTTTVRYKKNGSRPSYRIIILWPR